MSRLLTVPSNLSLSSYRPTTVQLQTLAAVLSGTNATINQAAEGFSVEYPGFTAVQDFVNGGGIYVDYCGWPMYYAEIIPTPTIFGAFLQNIGADPAYCDGFAVSMCGTYPYNRGWLTRGNIANPAGLIYGSGGSSCSSGETVYPMVVVKSTGGTGIYFYGAAGSTGAVDPTQFGQFILSVLGGPQGGSGPGNNSGSGGCQPGYIRNSSGVCVPLTGISQQKCVAGGGTWESGVCHPKQGGGAQPPAPSTNWPLWLGLGLGGASLVIGGIALFSGRE